MPDFPLPPPAFSGRSQRVAPGAPFDWLRQGWTTFAVAPGPWLGLALLFLLLELLPLLVFGFAWGLPLSLAVFPLLAAGLLAGCRRASETGRPAFADLGAGLRAGRQGLLQLGGLHLALQLPLHLLVFFLLRRGPGPGLGEADPLTPLLGWSVALGLAYSLLPLISLVLTSLFSLALPLVLFHRMAPLQALAVAGVAGLKNWLPCLVLGLLLSIMAFLATLFLGLGFLVLIPVWAGAMYAAYRDIFVST